MCGVAGIYSYKKLNNISREELVRINNAMAKRGPDGQGYWYSDDGYIGLCHRRLAILDLSKDGSQPMVSKNGRYVISFNGEIYNYPQLKKQLDDAGIVLDTKTDTETLLELYALKGIALFSELRGMFAFVIWDVKLKELICVRDPYGIKPLYYHDDGNTLKIASQVKALLEGFKISFKKDPASLVGFYLTGSIPEPHTLYKEIKSLEAGSYIKIDRYGNFSKNIFTDISSIISSYSEKIELLNNKDISQVLKEQIIETIEAHLLSDAKLGLFLSGGIDSSTIAGFGAQKAKIDTVTLCFKEYANTINDESNNSKRLIDNLEIKNTKLFISRKEFLNDMPQFFLDMDQPSIDGLNTWLISRFAKSLNWKVALSGIGADEIFGGYPSFCDIPKWVEKFNFISRRRVLSDTITKLLKVLPFDHFNLSPKIKGIFKYTDSYSSCYLLKRGLFLPEELPEIMHEDELLEGLENLDLLGKYSQNLNKPFHPNFLKISSLESCFYMRNQLLRDADWAGMAHSLEIRTPFVDIHFLKKVLPLIVQLPRLNKKEILGSVINNVVPKEIIQKKKTGFEVPLKEWLESSKDFDEWKKIPMLKNNNCPWSRRWAYTLIKNGQFK